MGVNAGFYAFIKSSPVRITIPNCRNILEIQSLGLIVVGQSFQSQDLSFVVLLPASLSQLSLSIHKILYSKSYSLFSDVNLSESRFLRPKCHPVIA